MADADTGTKKSSSSTLVMIAAFVGVLLIMFDPNLRTMLGNGVGAAFNPVISLWGYEHIVFTILFAGFIMIVATTVVRHFLVDWVAMARTQEVMRTFQKEFSDARKSNNTYKLKRLTDHQPEIMKMQADMSTGQLKPMAFTMLIVIPIFAWLSTIVAQVPVADPSNLCAPSVAFPWNADWSLGVHPKDQCARGWFWFLPHWILLYSLFSIPIGQVAQKLLKLWEYRHVDLDGDGRPAAES